MMSFVESACQEQVASLPLVRVAGHVCPGSGVASFDIERKTGAGRLLSEIIPTPEYKNPTFREIVIYRKFASL